MDLDTLCPRHRLIARFEHNLCGRCFEEALRYAEARLLEQRIAAMRLSSASAVLRRLNGR